MAYINYPNHVAMCSTPSASGEFGAYPFLDQISANEQESFQTFDPFAGGWDMGGQVDYMAVQPPDLQAAASFESVPSVASVAGQTHGYGQPCYPGYHWPTTGQYTQPHHSDLTYWDNHFTNALAFGAPAVLPAPNSAPLNYWGDNRSAQTTSASSTSTQTQRPPRTGSMSTARFHPYGTPRAHRNEHWNAEAGPSTLVPPPAKHMARPTTHPSGGTSEATADAETQQPITEEETAPITNTRRISHVRHQEHMRRLCVWAYGWKPLPKYPSFESALRIALEAIRGTQKPVYPEPRLRKGRGIRTAVGKTGPDREHRRRKGTRELNGDLSKYFLLAEGKLLWESTELLLKVLDEVEKIPRPPVEPPP